MTFGNADDSGTTVTITGGSGGSVTVEAFFSFHFSFQ